VALMRGMCEKTSRRRRRGTSHTAAAAEAARGVCLCVCLCCRVQSNNGGSTPCARSNWTDFRVYQWSLLFWGE